MRRKSRQLASLSSLKRLAQNANRPGFEPLIANLLVEDSDNENDRGSGEPSDDTHGTGKCVEIFAVGIAHVSALIGGDLDRRSTGRLFCILWQVLHQSLYSARFPLPDPTLTAQADH